MFNLYLVEGRVDASSRVIDMISRYKKKSIQPVLAEGRVGARTRIINIISRYKKKSVQPVLAEGITL